MNLEQFVNNSKRPLPVFLLLDTSGSMSGSKIEALNAATREMISSFKKGNFETVDIKLCIITFGGDAKLALNLTSVGDIEYSDLCAGGGTPLGGALRIAADMINNKEIVSSKGYKPTILLVSDGQPNDGCWRRELESFLTGKRTGKCERWAIAIGSDADRHMLSSFINNPAKQLFEASDASEIASFFNFVTMSTSVRAASVNPNESVNIEALKEEAEANLPEFKFDI